MITLNNNEISGVKLGDFDVKLYIGSTELYSPVALHEYIDLGLPSGTLWATMNVGASNVTDYGNYYLYGKGSSTILETYEDYDYEGEEDPVNSSVDTAYQAWGSAWHVPTKDQWEELVEYTDAEQVIISGVTGFLYTSKSNNNSIFLPNAGYKLTSLINTDIITDSGTRGKYLTSTPDDYDCWGYSQKLEFNENSLEVVSDYRDTGFSVRPVLDAALPQHEYIEIGGIKWATMNIGAENITDPGLYFLWGDTQGYTTSQVGTDKVFDWSDYKYSNNDGSNITKYSSTDGKTVLDLSDDAARANWGGQWRMPTIAEFEALCNACKFIDASGAEITGSNKLTTLNSVTGIYLEDKIDSSKRLFFPTAGYCYSSSVEDVDSYGAYWASSLKTIVEEGDEKYAHHLLFDIYYMDYQNSSSLRCSGFPIRPVIGL